MRRKIFNQSFFNNNATLALIEFETAWPLKARWAAPLLRLFVGLKWVYNLRFSSGGHLLLILVHTSWP